MKQANARMAGLSAKVGWPLLWGTAAASGFYVVLFRGPLNLPLLHRYFAGHPVSMAETVLFFTGLAALLLKLLEVVRQTWWLRHVTLPPAPPEGEEPHEAQRYLALLEQTPGGRRSWTALRARAALEHVVRTGSADRLEEELKYLAEQDQQRQIDSYALVRIVVWAIPMLGFLGTVMGIAQALGNLDPQQLATAPAQAMQGLLAGLYVAFDTTALALTLSLGLMFIQFPIDRLEVQLLAQIDHQVVQSLVGRFRTVGGNLDPHLASIERMCYAVIRATENVVQRQATIWGESLAYARSQWQEDWQQAGQTLRQSLTAALDDALANHGRRLEEIETRVADQTQQRWRHITDAFDRTVSLVQEQLAATEQQAVLWKRVLEATADVVKLEKALNDNLEQLAGSKHFEETVMSLAAAIQLLTARLHPASETKRIDLRPGPLPQERAA